MKSTQKVKCLKVGCARPQLPDKKYCYIHSRGANASFYSQWKRQQKDGQK